MWEKKCTESTCPAESQLDRRFDWVGATSVWLMALNSAGDRGFAGYDDWRLPTVLELSSLPPSGSSASGLGPTADRPYWSSSTSDADPARAWRVSFRETAKARLGKKSWIAQARAVRELSSGSAAMHIAKMPTECRTMRLCGNGVVDDNEACDGRDLAGQTCLSLGYAGDCSSSGECVASGLGCTPACRIDPTGCTSDGPDAARFVTDWDGTAIDRLTGLQWQRKCSGTDCSGGRHAGEVVDWQTAVTKWVDELNREDEKSSGAVDRWRLPNVAEARSILGETWKCGDGVCNTPEILGFEGPEEVYLWTSTTSANDTARAWRAALHEGSLDTAEKTMPLHALAVRLHSPRAAGSELAARQ
jgi:hypothetical protein